MTEPKDDDLALPLDLDLAQAAPDAPSPAPATPVAAGPEPAAAAPAEPGGQWVWQFAAPPPPQPFSAAFFSGHAFPELYRFFAAGVLVALGTLLPWGPTVAWMVERGNSTVGYSGPPAGFEQPIGALCLALALWLVWAACSGIYSGRQRILPVFLMLLPAWVTWKRTLDAWAQLSDADAIQVRLAAVFDVAGSGVLLALVGSSMVALQLLLTIVRLARKDPKAAEKARATKPRERKAGDEPAAASAGAAAGADEQGGRRGKKR